VSIRAILTVCLVAAGTAIRAEAPLASAKLLEAELLTRVTARGVNAGDTFYARVAHDWSGPGCHLRRGATLGGTVRSVTVHSHSGPSEMALSFDRAECTDAGLQPYQLILEALGASADAAGDLTAELPDPASIGVKTIQLHPDEQHIDMLPTLRSGEVRGMSGLRLDIGTGSQPVSVISDRSTDVHLDIRTRLLLRPARLLAAPRLSLPGAAAAEVFMEKPPVTVLLPETGNLELCAPPDCAAAPDADDTDQAYAGSISLRDLGYVSRSNREILAPSEDEALAWLSPTELLVTFNPHTLVPRHTFDSGRRPVRLIRAALIDTAKHTVKQTAEWELTDLRQFLWQLPGNRVLVHAGDEMRIYRSGMQVERRLRLAGPLGFARVSPDGKLLALGVIRERHTPELHAKLVDQLEQDPLEDMQVLLMNDRFETIGSVLANSDRLPPTLLNEGQLSLYVTPGQESKQQKHYVLQLRNWDHSSRALAHFSSGCTPQVSSLPPDLVFLVTCDKSNNAREYRVLRSDGRPLLHGASYMRELGHAVAPGGSPGTFALRIFKAELPTLPGEPFHASDLESAELIIYRCEDGKRLFRVRAKAPAASSAGYAVSPAGELAILTREDVDVYTVPRN
jgi:hypothetical protein